MQHAASIAQTAKSRSSSALVAGLGAVVVAFAITLTLMMSGTAPATATQQAADGSKNQCQVVHRAMLAATTGAGGTIRLREGDYVSPPIVLGPRAQLVNFPLPRPGATPAEDVIVIEGNASDVVLASPLTAWRQVFPKVDGVIAFDSKWAPYKSC